MSIDFSSIEKITETNTLFNEFYIFLIVICRSVDEWLPKAILDGTQSVLTLVGSVVITAMVNPYFLLPMAVIGLIFMYIRKVYLKTSKNIKRIEGIGEIQRNYVRICHDLNHQFFSFFSQISSIYAFSINIKWIINRSSIQS